MEKSDIAEWYKDQVILITGGTGFMGKVLIEKLLRSCPKIKKIYVIIRKKRNLDPEERLQNILHLPLFDYLRINSPEVFDKLISVAGDFALPNLGIDEENRKVLIENVTVVFHGAATVRFHEKLKLSVQMNIGGTKAMLELCKNMPKIKAFIHISTAFCNCDKPIVDETIYRTKTNPERIIQLTEILDDDIVEYLTPTIIENKPNSYIFTKALAEEMIDENYAELPVVIVRPSIVTAAFEEPIPGWIDNENGPTGLIIGGGKGVLRTVVCYTQLRADFVPVDLVINLTIAAAWDISNSKRNQIKVFNCASGKINPITWGTVGKYIQKFYLIHPFNNVLWYPGGTFKSSKLYNAIWGKLVHTLPAYILDFLALVTLKQPTMLRINKRMNKALGALEYFATNEWTFEVNNLIDLKSRMNSMDQGLFNFDVGRVQWERYIEQYVIGTRMFVLKEDDSSITTAKSHLRRLYYLHRFTQAIGFYLLWRVFIICCSFVDVFEA